MVKRFCTPTSQNDNIYKIYESMMCPSLPSNKLFRTHVVAYEREAS